MSQMFEKRSGALDISGKNKKFSGNNAHLNVLQHIFLSCHDIRKRWQHIHEESMNRI